MNKRTRNILILATAALLLAGCGDGAELEATPTAIEVVPTKAQTPADTVVPGVFCELPLPGPESWQVALCETFEDNSYGWQEEVQDNPYAAYTSTVAGGKFVIDYRGKNFAGFTRSALTWFDVAEAEDFILSVSGQIDSAFSDSSWGIAFRGNGEDFFLFSILNDDTYKFEIFEDNRWIPLITPKQTNLIKVGEPNTVRIEAGGQDFFFSINGEMVNQFNGALLEGAKIQLVVTAKEGASVLYIFDDIVLQK